MYAFLIERVRANLHIVLCMSPIGENFRNRLRQYPALVNCTTIDWFCEWPKEALLEVAMKYITAVNFAETITGERVIIIIKRNISLNSKYKKIYIHTYLICLGNEKRIPSAHNSGTFNFCSVCYFCYNP